MTLKKAYSYAVKFLDDNGIDEPDFKALCIVCHIDGIKNSEYMSHSDDEITLSVLDDMLLQLKSGKPLQYALGKWDFYNSEFCVGEGVLIPRPETEELVELAVNKIKTLGKCVVFDLCAGSGCIGISIARECPEASVYLVEKSEQAFYYLLKNAQGVDNVFPVNADINDKLDLPMADVIVSNPPYIKSSDISSLQSEVLCEPAMALDGGSDGLDFYRIINDKWYCAFNQNGLLYLEIGNEQGTDIIPVLNNFTDIEIIKDIYGNDRMVRAVAKG